MLVFIRILASVYFLSVNFYGFLLIKFQKKKRVEDCKNKIKEENENNQVKCEVNNTNENETAPQENSPQKDTALLDDNSKPQEKTTQCPQKDYKDCENQLSKVSDGKIVLAGALGGALGVYIAMFVYKHRLTNFLFMVIMPIFITIYVYLLIIGFSNNFWIIKEGI